VARESRAVQNPTVLMVDHAIERNLCVTRNTKKVSPGKSTCAKLFSSSNDKVYRI